MQFLSFEFSNLRHGQLLATLIIGLDGHDTLSLRLVHLARQFVLLWLHLDTTAWWHVPLTLMLCHKIKHPLRAGNLLLGLVLRL
jgi:hypothetical protein